MPGLKINSMCNENSTLISSITVGYCNLVAFVLREVSLLELRYSCAFPLAEVFFSLFLGFFNSNVTNYNKICFVGTEILIMVLFEMFHSDISKAFFSNDCTIWVIAI